MFVAPVAELVENRHQRAALICKRILNFRRDLLVNLSGDEAVFLELPKVLIDRCCSQYTRISNKKAYFIATCADGRKESMDAAVASFRGFLECLNNVEEAGLIYATGVTDIGDIEGKPEMAIAYKMGKAV